MNRRQEITVLAHWYELIQQTDLPPLCKSLHVLEHGVRNLAIDPFPTAEDAPDIWGRLIAVGRSSEKDSVLALFALARQRFDAS